jgi:hypothetical protein
MPHGKRRRRRRGLFKATAPTQTTESNGTSETEPSQTEPSQEDENEQNGED